MDEIKIMNKSDITNLKIIINLKINEKFSKLNEKGKVLIKKYLHEACILTNSYFKFEKFIEQITMNNCQDLFSILNLLLPYFELNKSNEINNLDEIFTNKDNKSKDLDSTYYIDHLEYTKESNYLEKYFLNSLISLENTYKKVSSKLLPNWLNVFPYTIDDYTKSPYYKNLRDLIRNKKILSENDDIRFISKIDNLNYDIDIDFIQKKLLLGYENLYGTIYNFLYNDIKTIKWMIYEDMSTGIPIPNIIILANLLEINNVSNKKWEQLEDGKKDKIFTNWNNIKEDKKYFTLIRSLILFYLRWEFDEDTLKKVTMDKDCSNIIRTKLKKDDENYDDEIIYLNYEKNKLNIKINDCIEKIKNSVYIENIYLFIYKCMQKFRYTWYGYICTDSLGNILNTEDFLNKYMNYPIKIEENNKYIITPKNIYNFFKSLIHKQNKKEYLPISNSFSWDSMDIESKNIFITRLNTISKEEFDSEKSWFNIKNNLLRIYPEEDNTFIEIINQKIKDMMKEKLLAIIVIETLVINNMLSYIKYNPKVTDFRLLPDKNKESKKWEETINSNIEIENYGNSYSFLSNRTLSSYNEDPEKNGDYDIFKVIKETKWYNNFGSNWLAQIQIFHHIINQRVMYITGATGAGKSTVFPFMYLYSQKMLYFNNNCKVAITEPRIQPTVQNPEYITKFLGLPFIKNNKKIEKEDNEDNEDNNKIIVEEELLSKYISQNINYLQYKHMEDGIVDDEYHPCLKFLTDGTLLNIFKTNYLLKKQNLISDDKSEEGLNFTKENVYDGILIDESHEHGPNMDMILTLARFSVYINNQVTLGIISATMEDDEKTYRKYYELIDDNWKYPLDYNYETKNKYTSYNSNFIDRRLHLSPPFFSTNFKIDEIFMEIDDSNENIQKIVNTILSEKKTGDILIFQSGQDEIVKLVALLNKTLPSEVLAVPFYSKLKPSVLDRIKEIAKPEIREQFILKKEINIDKLNELKPNEKVRPGTYNRFIIVATNIAEASITIDTLEYVIDVGTQKVNKYDPNTDSEKLNKVPIAIPNQKQRRGRVGRKKPGKVYYLYDIKKLEKRVLFKITLQNITDMILQLITTSDTKLINEESDPYKVNNLDLIPECLRSQYGLYSLNSKETVEDNNNKDKSLLYQKIYSRDKIPDYLTKFKVIYPYSDGKYDIDTLTDMNGEFYIIHPNELDFERRINLETEPNLSIISKKENYQNTPLKIIETNIMRGILDSNGKITKYGILIINIMSIFNLPDIKFICSLIDCYSFNLNTDSEVFSYLVLMFLIHSKNYILQNPKYIKGLADFLVKLLLFPKKLFEEINIDLLINQITINNEVDKNIYSIKKKIELELKKTIENYKKYFKNIVNGAFVNSYIRIIQEYYVLKTLFKMIGNKMFKKFNIDDKKKYNSELNNKFANLNDYDKFIFILIKNYPKNLYIRISETKYYVNYYDTDINNLYKLYSFIDIKSKKEIYTNLVNKDLVGDTIFAYNVESSNMLQNLVWISRNVINILNVDLDYKKLKKKNTKLDLVKIEELNTEEAILIKQKIDKIIKKIQLL